ncbi:hypothetical protein [Nonomuraea bangladeshensis]|uniref:hypothetical protein n=1 Tax=Nonomuraea bangladeshensis TaxID=404385 RepID=UPI0031E2F6A4
MTLATLDLPVEVVATGEDPVANVILNVPEFYRDLAATLRAAADEVETIPDTNPRAPGGPPA